MSASRPGVLAALGIAAGAGIWAGAGFWLAKDGVTEMYLYRYGLTVAALAPVAFVLIYTAIGITGKVAAAWWRTTIGTALVVAALSLVPIAAPLAWVFWFDGGVLHSSWLAWLEVSGPCVSALAWLGLAALWLWTAAHARVSPGK